MIAIKFVPIFIEEMERLARAQTARGVPFDEGGALTVRAASDACSSLSSSAASPVPIP